MQRTQNSQTGFTIIETLVAIFILLVSVTGPLAFAQGGLRASFVARDQVVAFYLAQDAIETIKNVRDNNSLDGEDWLDGISTHCASNSLTELDSPCEIETDRTGSVTNPNTLDCGGEGGQCGPLKFNTANKEFLLSTNADANSTVSKYTRTVYINEINSGKEAQIIVEVTWDTTFFSERRIVVQENIYNWIPRYTP